MAIVRKNGKKQMGVKKPRRTVTKEPVIEIATAGRRTRRDKKNRGGSVGGKKTERGRKTSQGRKNGRTSVSHKRFRRRRKMGKPAPVAALL